MHFFRKNISVYAIFNDQSFNDMLTSDIVSFEQLGPGIFSAYITRETTFVTSFRFLAYEKVGAEKHCYQYSSGANSFFDSFLL